MRFPSRGRWLLWLVLLLALAPFVLIFPASLWLGWTMNPVQTFYLGTYAACSTLSSYPGSGYNRSLRGEDGSGTEAGDAASRGCGEGTRTQNSLSRSAQRPSPGAGAASLSRRRKEFGRTNCGSIWRPPSTRAIAHGSSSFVPRST